MATPRRRSARLQGAKTPVGDGPQQSVPGCFPKENILKCNLLQARSNETSLQVKLSSLAEGDESQSTPRNTSAPQFSIVVPSSATSYKHAPQKNPPALRTPPASSKIQPGMEEMHPSKVHRSTTKPIGSASQFITGDVETVKTAPLPSSSALADSQTPPTKLPGAWPSMLSPKFDFTVGKDESALSMEAQRIMESVRGEAAKIKAQMQAERDKQDLDDKETHHNSNISGRKIAQPKGKSGRYSDAHREQFKRMDSIAGHASVWKNRIQPNASLLASKSHLDPVADVVETQLPRSKSFKSLNANRAEDGDRLENLASGKRIKKSYGDDTSSVRPISRDESVRNETTQSTASKTSLQSRLLSAITTPTKASLARTASVKHLKPSLIPSPSRGSLKQSIGSPIMFKSEGSKKYRQSLAKFGDVKSFIHRRQFGIANDPNKESLGPSLAVSEDKLRFDKALPSLPQPVSTRLLSSPPTVDSAEFTPVKKSKMDLVPVSPSPSKIPEAPYLHKPNTALAPGLITYPSIANSPNITTRVKIPTAPIDFTFRSERSILFNSKPQTPTIRRVRPSGVSTPVAVFNPLPPIPHGLPNKKRRRASSDDDIDIENVPPADEPRTKKLKSSPQKNTSLQQHGTVHSTAGTTSSPSKIPQARGGRDKGRSRSVLSLSRLNMLARPKSRR